VVIFLLLCYVFERLFVSRGAFDHMTQAILVLSFIYVVLMTHRVIRRHQGINKEMQREPEQREETDTRYGRLFTYTVESVAFALVVYTLLSGVGDTLLYNRVYFFGQDAHQLSVLMLITSFLLHWTLLRYLYPITRFVVASALMVWYIYTGNAFWTLNSVMFRLSGFYIFVYFGWVIVTYLLYQLNAKNSYIKPDIDAGSRILVVGLMCLQIAGMLGMAFTGFWEAMTLSDMGLGPDPNQNIWWVVWKLSSYWMLLPLLRVSDLKAPLVLRPLEVF
jgi:hypothetical protein